MAAAILVDSSIWIAALRGSDASLTAQLEHLLRVRGMVATTGLVIQEVLQGLTVPREVARVSSLLLALPHLVAKRETHVRAAALFRKLRAKGVTSHTVDLLLAQLCIEHRTALWSLDAHFEDIASASRLRLYR